MILPAIMAARPQSYIGPLDIQGSAVVAYSSVRAMSAAMRGQNAITIREDDGDTTQSFSSDGSTGVVSAAAITSFLDGATGFVTTWADQSGNARNAVQATIANQPQVNPAGAGGASVYWPTLDDMTLVTGGNLTMTVATGFTAFLVARVLQDHDESIGVPWFIRDAIDTGDETGLITSVDTLNALTLDLEAQNTAVSEQVSVWTDPAIPGYANGVFLCDVSLKQDGTGLLFYNGADHTSIAEVGTGAVPEIVGPLTFGDPNPVARFKGELWEFIYYAGIVSSDKRIAIRQNIADFYSIALSP